MYTAVINSCNVSLSADTNVVDHGSNVSLTCRVCNVDFKSVIEFYKDNLLIAYRALGINSIINYTLHRLRTSSEKDVTTLTLVILNFHNTSQGNYTCKVFYTATSATQYMTLAGTCYYMF